jgi:hypothetical protein
MMSDVAKGCKADTALQGVRTSKAAQGRFQQNYLCFESQP